MALNGYDISDNQGNINNSLVPGDFIFIKATEGVGYTDPDCDANYQQAKAAGKLPGVYHFARPDGNDPVSEAKWFVSQIQGYLGEAILALDLEVNPVTPQWTQTWLDTVYSLTQVRPILYMSQSRFNAADWSAVLPNYAAWVAAYGANNPQTGYGDPNAPVSINGNWTIFGVQYTSAGRLPGWNGSLDLDLAYVTPAGWVKYAQGDRNQPAPVVTPPVEPIPVVIPPVVEPIPVEPTPEPQPTQPDGTPIPTPTEPVQTQSWLISFLKALIDFLKGFFK